MIFTVASFAVEQCLTAGSGQRLTAILCYSIGIANGTCKTGVVGRFEHSWQLLVISRASGACIAIARMRSGLVGWGSNLRAILAQVAKARSLLSPTHPPRKVML